MITVEVKGYDMKIINELIDEAYEMETIYKISYPDAYREMVLEFEQIKYERLMDTL